MWRDQRLKCTFISIFYGTVLYLPNFRKMWHTWENIVVLAKTTIWPILLLNSVKS